MKRIAISLMLAFSTMTGLAACGPEQVDASEAPATGEITAALSCPGPEGYYYCPADPTIVVDYYLPACSGPTMPTANFARADCTDYCGAPCLRVTY